MRRAASQRPWRLGAVTIVDGTVPDFPTGEFMSLVKGILKTAIVIKLAEVAQRELSKPENQRKIKEGIRKVQDAAWSRR
jgi:hypothetical protein